MRKCKGRLKAHYAFQTAFCYVLKVKLNLFAGLCVRVMKGFELAVTDFAFAQCEQTHDLVFLVVAHLLPVKPLFATAQAAFAIAFGIGFAYADAGAGNGKQIGLLHDGKQKSDLL